jgi:AcrR family transcriptional regulator
MAQFTKKAIIEGFMELLNERPFDKITVVDVAERCEINRNTFYYYFDDLYALVDEILRMETQKILDMDIRCDTWADAFTLVTEFDRRNKRAIFNLYHSPNWENVEKHLYSITLTGMTAVMEKEAEHTGAQAEDIRSLAVFYTAALLGLMTRWLHEDMKYDADAYIANLSNLLEGSAKSALVRSGQKGRQGEKERQTSDNKGHLV